MDIRNIKLHLLTSSGHLIENTNCLVLSVYLHLLVILFGVHASPSHEVRRLDGYTGLVGTRPQTYD